MDLSGARWRKPSRGGDNGGVCVEVAAVPDAIAVRDSNDPGGPALASGGEAGRRFSAAAKSGRFDRP